MSRHIFHIAANADWQRARENGSYDVESLAIEGFIHCSHSHQVVEVANRLFQGRADLVLLRIARNEVDAAIKEENCGGGEILYPHVYGTLNLNAIVEVLPLFPRADGTFLPPWAFKPSSA